MFIYKWKVGWFSVLHHFQQYFSYIMVVSFIGGGNRKLVSCKSPEKRLFILFLNEF